MVFLIFIIFIVFLLIFIDSYWLSLSVHWFHCFRRQQIVWISLLTDRLERGGRAQGNVLILGNISSITYIYIYIYVYPCLTGNIYIYIMYKYISYQIINWILPVIKRLLIAYTNIWSQVWLPMPVMWAHAWAKAGPWHGPWHEPCWIYYPWIVHEYQFLSLGRI